MTTTLNEPTVSNHQNRRAWIVACALTSLVTIAGFVVAIQQFVVKYLWDNWMHTRTLYGAGFMLLGVLGLSLPLMLLFKRKQFAAAPTTQQWVAAIGVPLCYVLAFGLLVEASLRSTTMILPRADTLTAVIGYEHGKFQVNFRGKRRRRFGDFSHINTRNGVERFFASLAGAYSPRRGREPSVLIQGQARRLESGTMQVVLDVKADEPITFAVEDLDSVKMTRDGEPIDGSDAVLGKFRLTITGRASRNR